MARTSLARSGRKVKRCRTNRGRFMRLESLYRRGALSDAQAIRYEDMIRDLWALEREASA